GLGLIVACGGLCRLWFRHWRWFIIPITLLVAVNPSILWYEHTLMAEPLYVDMTVLLALAGTLFVLRKTARAFVFLCIALVLESGARPEGKLFFCFGIFLVLLAYWGDWSRMKVALPSVGTLGLVMHFLTKTSQAGLLLYTSLVHFTPDQMKAAPGF